MGFEACFAVGVEAVACFTVRKPFFSNLDGIILLNFVFLGEAYRFLRPPRPGRPCGEDVSHNNSPDSGVIPRFSRRGQHERAEAESGAREDCLGAERRVFPSGKKEKKKKTHHLMAALAGLRAATDPIVGAAGTWEGAVEKGRVGRSIGCWVCVLAGWFGGFGVMYGLGGFG